MASHISGKSHKVSSLPELLNNPTVVDIDISGLAISSLTDGCLIECFSADAMRFSLDNIHDPLIRKTTEKIEKDERFHGELSWEIFWFLNSRLESKNRPDFTQELQKFTDNYTPILYSREILDIASKTDSSFKQYCSFLEESEIEYLWDHRINFTKKQLKNFS